MHSGGIEVGSHTQSHPALTTLTPARITQEIAGSKQVLEEKTGDTVKSFCYPTGAYNQYTPLAVKEAGYTSAVTVVYRKATPQDDPYILPRIRVFKAASIAAFVTSLK
jgi:peptidoglycan/xylan/chitin deacetylase (PgdA/CDA1 family)